MSGHSERAGTLHLLLAANKATWRDCVRHCQATDTVVLLDAGVMGLAWPDEEFLGGFSCEVLVSGVDAAARLGRSPGMGSGVRRISDDELVGLLESHPRCLSWR